MDNSLENLIESAVPNANNQASVELDSIEKIMTYGDEITKGISRFADEILHQFSLTHSDEGSKLLSILTQLMEKFNRGDFQENSVKGFFTKLFQKNKTDAGSIYNKYTQFNSEIDKIFIEVKKYEFEIKDTNDLLEKIYDKNKQYYAELAQYINIANDYKNNTLVPYIESLRNRIMDPADGMTQIELTKYLEIEDVLEQRVHDLELAKAVSLQTAPQIKMLQKGNNNLLRKMNSAFVITMPLFKQGIIQAIAIRRQKLHMDSMAALDESTNRLIKQNAANTVDNYKKSIQMNGTGAVRIEALEEAYNTIINGINEVEVLQKENKMQRAKSIDRMQELKQALIAREPIKTQEFAETIEMDA